MKKTKRTKHFVELLVVFKINLVCIIFAFLAIALVSCDSDGIDEDPQQEPDPNDYFLEDPNSEIPSVNPQFQTYYFAENDATRKIYVYGKDGNSTETEIELIKLVNSIDAEVGSNTWQYWKKIDNNYTLPIKVDGSMLYNNEFCEIKAKKFTGSSPLASNVFVAKKIEARVLDINEYHFFQISANRADILNAEFGVEPKQILLNIFNEARISINFAPTPQPAFIDAPIPLSLNFANELRTWAYLIPDIADHHNEANYIVLIGVPNYSQTEAFTAFSGTASTHPDYASIAWVFTDRTSFGDDILSKKSTVKTTAHELGHIRGKFLTPEEGEDFGVMAGLTDDPHTYGHWGNHNALCLMLYVTGASLFQNQIENPHFCEGHLQMLLNTTFQ